MSVIGTLDHSEIVAHAKSLQTHGGLPVSGMANSLGDLPVCDASTIYSITRTLAKGRGGILMSSGGTTGKPKLTVNTFDQACGRLLAEWKPLGPADVLLNLFNPGRLWGSHYYMQELASASQAIIAPAGPYAIEDVSNWMSIFDHVKLNALAGTPTGLYEFALGVQMAGRSLPIEKIIWMAEPWVDGKREFVESQFPQAKFWGNYGSVETYVIGTNNPKCDPYTFHLMKDQIIEIDDEGALLSRVGAGWTVPIVRYRIRDELKPVRCRCGRADAFMIVGRSDDSISLRSILFSVNELRNVALGTPGVSEVQLVCSPDADNPKAAASLTISYVGTADTHEVMRQVISSFYHMPAIIRSYKNALNVERVNSLLSNPRTQKTVPLVWRQC
ncbi:hypothetical protein N2603_35235 [Bradyrhizobium huanghuaihaiense]|uniref:hypothetical protein n=1 Tax=Bradyrhizobium huanghuaihaiense TaxID=990078 RepID=UPI0021AAAB61|nr:hypothetical protein [Bradyrhizobium sp. CB3035]UWU75259.1 hypothetical protein N2603_35235 [Bradyrhizobium sp. CB3035]